MLSIIKDVDFLSAFFQAVIIIFLGYFLRKKNVLDHDGKKALTAVIWKLAVPCMAFNAFMRDIDYSELLSSIEILILAFVMYIFFVLMGKLLFRRLGKSKANVCALMFAIGQATLFAMPIVKSIYGSSGNDAMLSINIMTIAFRVMVYIVAFFIISGTHFSRENIGGSLKTIFVNPVIIAMFVGMLIWLTQNFLPQVNIGGESYCFLRIDKTLPVFYKTVLALENLVGPLSMLLIGLTLGESDLKSAFSDKLVWLVSAMRTVAAPVIVLIVILLCRSVGANISGTAGMSLIFGFAAPASVTLNVFCLQYHCEEQLSSRICMLSTLMCIVTLPIVYGLGKSFGLG